VSRREMRSGRGAWIPSKARWATWQGALPLWLVKFEPTAADAMLVDGRGLLAAHCPGCGEAQRAMSVSVSRQHHRALVWNSVIGVGVGALLILLAYKAGLFPYEAPTSTSVLNPKAAAGVAANNAFAFDLFAQVRINGNNLVLSPYSVSTCLGLTFAGARGNTERQMAKALHFDTSISTHRLRNIVV
jgi:hypothetical protein